MDSEHGRIVIPSGVFCRELVGRASELKYLLERVRARGSRSSALVVLRGEAGIGKSRLVEEMAAVLRADGLRIVSGSTREYANAPYAALEEAFAPLGVSAVQSFEGALGDAKTRRFNAIADGIADAANACAGGLLAVVEDLHWADLGTLDLLRFLAGRLASCNVTFVVTYRHDEMESDSARARSIGALEREAQALVTLDTLTAIDMDRLLASVIQYNERPVSAAVVAKIRELSDGRPLFAEELLRGVFERLDRDVNAEPSVPTSIRVTVRERFRTLNDADRTVLLHAAIVGRRFSARFVSAFSSVELSVVYGALRRARDLQLVIERPDEEGDDFAFRHALTRETIYAELLRAEARLLHGKVAQALAAEQKPEVAAIAEHLWRAGASDAAAWNERAGDEALALYSYADAARVYERALGITTDAAHRAYLGERAAECWYALGDLPHSIEWFGHAADAQLAAGVPARAWRLQLRKARVLFESGRYDAGLEEADRLASTVDVEANLRFEAEVMVAGLLTSRGRATAALERLRRAELLGATPEPLVTARFAATYAMTLGILGESDTARQRFEVAVQLAREIGDADLRLRTYNNWGNFEIAFGTVARARALYDEAMVLAEATKNRRIAAWITTNAALPAVLSGEIRYARSLLERSAGISHGVNVVHRWGHALALHVATLEGEHDDDDIARARTMLDEAIDDVDLSALAMLASVVAYRLGAQQQTRAAAELLARVMPVFEQVDAPYWLVDAASQYGDAPTRARARELITIAASTNGAGPARGVLALIDAREALRRRRRDECTTLAGSAVEAFRASGWTLAEGYALELAGQVADAVTIFRRCGATADVRRNTETRIDLPRRRGESTLTGREREIAGFVAAGHATKAIADMLVISERTVETHIASIYRKLGVTNRRALESLLADAAPT
ncbi:MAG: LuxR family transcriptional regulator [Candidatus Elarobacter sp.]